VRIGLVGTGIVGTHLGLRLADAGHALTIHDLEPDAMAALAARGATVAASPRAVAAATELAVTAVPTERDALEVALGPDGLMAGAAPGFVHVEMSTVGAPCVKREEAEAAPHGVRVIDAPLSAGPRRDQHQELTLWVGAPAALFAQHRALLGQLAEHVVWCGPVGHAQLVKLVNNLITLQFSTVLGDALCLGVKAGVPLEILRLALFWGTAQNRLMDDLFPWSVFAGDWRPGYTVELAAKDFELAKALAASTGAPLPSAAPLEAAFAAARERGWDQLSVHSLLRLSEENAGVELRLNK
jgi:3-hydroxyisobutyrate dehydrogenase-like beta-hydroxyacid dehydrogenase